MELKPQFLTLRRGRTQVGKSDSFEMIKFFGDLFTQYQIESSELHFKTAPLSLEKAEKIQKQLDSESETEIEDSKNIGRRISSFSLDPDCQLNHRQMNSHYYLLINAQKNYAEILRHQYMIKMEYQQNQVLDFIDHYFLISHIDFTFDQFEDPPLIKF